MSNNRYHSERSYLRERHAHKTRIGGHETAVKFQREKGSHKNRGFVIKKRKG